MNGRIRNNNNNKEKWILYSTCDEDSLSELRALNISERDRVVSVTGSGCRTLSLLSCNPNSLVSVDYSAGQNYLLELKLAAIRELSYDGLLRFLGIDRCAQRWQTFELLERYLSPQAAAYFRRYRSAIQKGVLFSGRHELFYARFVVPIVHLLFGRTLKRIFDASTVEEQRNIYKGQLDGTLWRWLVRNGFSESTLRFILNDNQYSIEIDVSSVGDYVLDRLHHTFSHHLSKNNHWINFMLNGKYPNRNCLPHFLLYASYEAISRAKTELTIITEDLGGYLQKLPSKSVDKFSLSDVTSCVDRQQFRMLLREVARTSRPGGRLCYRNFLAKYAVSFYLEGIAQRDDAVCSSLDQDDMAFVYSFEVATISGTC